MRDILPVSVEALLSHTPLFSGLASDEIARIASATQPLRVSRGDMLFYPGDRCKGVHILAHGKVKLFLTSAQGGEKVVDIVEQGGSFGEALMFMDKDYIVSGQAITDSLLLHVGKEALFAELDKDPQLGIKMLLGLASREYRLLCDVESYSLHSGIQRLIGYLLHETPEQATDDAPFELTLNAPKGVIASRLNLTQEHFSRLLGELSGRGLIEVNGALITITSLARLRAAQF